MCRRCETCDNNVTFTALCTSAKAQPGCHSVCCGTHCSTSAPRSLPARAATGGMTQTMQLADNDVILRELDGALQRLIQSADALQLSASALQKLVPSPETVKAGPDVSCAGTCHHQPVIRKKARLVLLKAPPWLAAGRQPPA